MKPRIDRTNLKSLVTKAERNIKFDINVDGEPPPEIKWWFNGQEVIIELLKNSSRDFFIFYFFSFAY